MGGDQNHKTNKIRGQAGPSRNTVKISNEYYDEIKNNNYSFNSSYFGLNKSLFCSLNSFTASIRALFTESSSYFSLARIRNSSKSLVYTVADIFVV
jgi:hypothetical protein